MKASELKITKKLSPLYKLERKLNLKTLIIFTIIGAVLTFATTLMFLLVDDMINSMQSIIGDNEEFKNLIDQLLQYNNFASYFITNVGSTWGLIGIIYAGFLGCKLINSNLKDNSYETLYTLEYSRTKILLTKLTRLVINVVIFNLLTAFVGFIGICIIGINQVNIGNFVLYILVSTLVCLMIGMLSFALSCLFKRKYGTILSIVFALAFYFISQFSVMGNNFKAFEYLSPAYGTFAPILEFGLTNFNFVSLVMWLIISVGILAFGIFRFNKDDII